jgi:replication factor A1
MKGFTSMRDKKGEIDFKPRSNPRSYSEKRLYEYLANLSVKYDADPEEFFQALMNTLNDENSTCGELFIECRRKTDDSATFLFTNGKKIISQFTIPRHLLHDSKLFKKYVEEASSRTTAPPNEGLTQIKDLKGRMTKVNVKAHVVEISQPKIVLTRFGFQTYVSTAVVEDETDSIDLSLWNKQIDLVSPGDTILIENGQVAIFRGKRQLRLGRNGRLSVVEDEAVQSVMN